MLLYLVCLFVCLTLLASFFFPSHLSFKNMYIKFGTKALVVLLSQPCPSAAWLGVGVYTDSFLEVVADECH